MQVNLHTAGDDAGGEGNAASGPMTLPVATGLPSITNARGCMFPLPIWQGTPYIHRLSCGTSYASQVFAAFPRPAVFPRGADALSTDPRTGSPTDRADCC